jgi:hypothetical protein
MCVLWSSCSIQMLGSGKPIAIMSKLKKLSPEGLKKWMEALARQAQISNDRIGVYLGFDADYHLLYRGDTSGQKRLVQALHKLGPPFGGQVTSWYQPGEVGAELDSVLVIYDEHS